MTHSRSPDDGVQSISVTQFQTSNCAIETIGSLADIIRRRSQSWRILRRFDGFGKTSVASCLLCCLRAHKIPLATVSFATRCHWGEETLLEIGLHRDLFTERWGYRGYLVFEERWKEEEEKNWTAPRYFHFREVEMEMLNLMLRQLPSATHSKESNKQCFFVCKKSNNWPGSSEKKILFVQHPFGSDHVY